MYNPTWTPTPLNSKTWRSFLSPCANMTGVVTRLVETGKRRAAFFRNMSDEELEDTFLTITTAAAQTALSGGYSFAPTWITKSITVER
jgi:hypothetical protein